MRFSRLQAIAGFLVAGLGCSDTVTRTATISIDSTITYQTIDGFGVSQVGDVSPAEDYAATLNDWPEPQRTEILDLAFSQTNGIGLTIFRIHASTDHPDLLASAYRDPSTEGVVIVAINTGAIDLSTSFDLSHRGPAFRSPAPSRSLPGAWSRLR